MNITLTTRRLTRLAALLPLVVQLLLPSAPQAIGAEVVGAEAVGTFAAGVGALLSQKCLRCHDANEANGGLVLETRAGLLAGGDSGRAVELDAPAESRLLQMIQGEKPAMPQGGPPLTPAEVAVVQAWLEQGATWPESVVLRATDERWWSLTPPAVTPLPQPIAQDPWVRTPVDGYVLQELRNQGLQPSPEADRRTLIRRLAFDLTGLPPTPTEVAEFLADADPRAYERLVDRLLDSPHYGERWARHWLDVVHYGDTHGYDKDKLRPNAWPYRDYVIKSLNDDKPYARFVSEQLAGDSLWPTDPQAIVATGFIAAGPWDFIGHAEVPETKIDGQVARNLDRDDMVTSTINTFLSTTVQCARCHDHKFDPIKQSHYYGLQAVFAALDRADRDYDPDPAVANARVTLQRQLADQQARLDDVAARLKSLGAADLADTMTRALAGTEPADSRPAEYGYHSQIESTADRPKWVQVDLGRSIPLSRIVLVACHDDFNGIGAGFGFPRQYDVELSDDPTFSGAVPVITIPGNNYGPPAVPPGVAPQSVRVTGSSARYVRVNATELAPRQNDYIFALAELLVLDDQGTNVALGAAVTALDSIEAPVRWQTANLVDGKYPLSRAWADESLTNLPAWIAQGAPQYETFQAEISELREILAEWQRLRAELQRLPAPQRVYAGTIHHGDGTFRGTGHQGGKPREIHVLERGEVTLPRELVLPGAFPLIPDTTGQFELSADAPESARRVALAEWIVRDDNPLTWRSVVNRVWLYHFGRGLVASPNDFGRMGELPSHPELLDWLAIWFRDNGQSLKSLHRLIVTSSVYRQTAADDAQRAIVDAENRWLWRMNRRAVDAEGLRDSMLAVSGRLRTEMYGPGFQDFVIEHPEHSPHYEYHLHDPADVTAHRRSIYRFLVRSQQQPFMQSLDCADPSQSIPQRDTTLTAIQALTLLNNQFVLYASQQFAERLASEADELTAQVRRGCELALCRPPTDEEQAEMVSYARRHGLANFCRLLVNLNEFAFVD